MHRRQRQHPNCLKMCGAARKLSAALSYNNSCEDEKEWMRGATHAFVRLCSLFTPPQVLNSLCHVAHKVLAGACDWTEGELYDENPNNPRAQVTSSILFHQTIEEALQCSRGDLAKLWTNCVERKKYKETTEIKACLPRRWLQPIPSRWEGKALGIDHFYLSVKACNIPSPMGLGRLINTLSAPDALSITRHHQTLCFLGWTVSLKGAISSFFLHHWRAQVSTSPRFSHLHILYRRANTIFSTLACPSIHWLCQDISWCLLVFVFLSEFFFGKYFYSSPIH